MKYESEEQNVSDEDHWNICWSLVNNVTTIITDIFTDSFYWFLLIYWVKESTFIKK